MCFYVTKYFRRTVPFQFSLYSFLKCFSRSYFWKQVSSGRLNSETYSLYNSCILSFLYYFVSFLKGHECKKNKLRFILQCEICLESFLLLIIITCIDQMLPMSPGVGGSLVIMTENFLYRAPFLCKGIWACFALS